MNPQGQLPHSGAHHSWGECLGGPSHNCGSGPGLVSPIALLCLHQQGELSALPCLVRLLQWWTRGGAGPPSFPVLRIRSVIPYTFRVSEVERPLSQLPLVLMGGVERGISCPCRHWPMSNGDGSPMLTSGLTYPHLRQQGCLFHAAQGLLSTMGTFKRSLKVIQCLPQGPLLW